MGSAVQWLWAILGESHGPADCRDEREIVGTARKGKSPQDRDNGVWQRVKVGSNDTLFPSLAWQALCERGSGRELVVPLWGRLKGLGRVGKGIEGR